MDCQLFTPVLKKSKAILLNITAPSITKQTLFALSLLQNGYFTVTAIDNINRNPSLTQLVHLFMALPYWSFKKQQRGQKKQI